MMSLKKNVVLCLPPELFSFFELFCLMPVIFVIQLPFQCYLCFFTVGVTFNKIKEVLLFEKFKNFSQCPELFEFNCCSWYDSWTYTSKHLAPKFYSLSVIGMIVKGSYTGYFFFIITLHMLIKIMKNHTLWPKVL